jgi:mono/diheme cytochrome c family protein
MKVTHFFATAMLVLGTAFPTFAQDTAPAGDAKAGQATFQAVGCWQCHGTVAQGGATTGPRLSGMALPYAAFIQQIRVPQNAMAPYEAKSLSDGDAANIYAWLKSLPAPKAVKDIPLLANQ